MGEFKLHRLIIDLIKLLESKSAPEEHVEKIQKEIAKSNPVSLNTVVSQSWVRSLTKHSSTPVLFVEKYEELKSKKIDLLPSFIQLLDLISKDEELKSSLAKNAVLQSISYSKPSMITTEDLPEICKNVIKAAVEGEKKFNKQANAAMKKLESTLIICNWVVERPRISWDFHNHKTINLHQKIVPMVSQESILMWDLLSCFKGIDGFYIMSEPLIHPHGIKTFAISSDINISLKQLAQQILPLASHYSMIVRFVEGKVSPEDGQVNHALRGAIRCLLKDYLLFVVQLEMEHTRGKLNLQKLWFYIQPTMATMSLLSQITSTIRKANARGGKVLSLLHEQANNISGEAKSKELCLSLIQAASVPYMQTLEKWVYKGVICDPYHEFLVEDNELIQREELPVDYSADYWEKRYTMRSERIPVFLSEHAQTILRTGKYFNVIRQCGKTIQWGKQEPLVYQHQGQKYIMAIDRAYSEAARTLLEVLIHENDLMGRLRSVKNYFLLAQGDFMVNILWNTFHFLHLQLFLNSFQGTIHELMRD